MLVALPRILRFTIYEERGGERGEGHITGSGGKEINMKILMENYWLK